MAVINISERDFHIVAWAACKAKALGLTAEAQTLDKLARKINAALSNAESMPGPKGFMRSKGEVRLKWTDVPSVLEAAVSPLKGMTVPGVSQVYDPGQQAVEDADEPELRTYVISILRSSIVNNPNFGKEISHVFPGKVRDILDAQGNVVGQERPVTLLYEIGCPTRSFDSRPFLYRFDPSILVKCRFCGETFPWKDLVDTIDYSGDYLGSETTCPRCREEECCALNYETIEQVFGTGEWYRYSCPDCGKRLPSPEDPRVLAGWVPEELRIVPAPSTVYFCHTCLQLKSGNWRPIEETLSGWKAHVIDEARAARAVYFMNLEGVTKLELTSKEGDDDPKAP